MLTNLRIERFKCYREKSFRLAPLTVLAGTNGAGKSTVIQALLLLRICSENGTYNVELNGRYGLNLGEVLDVLHRDSDASEGIRLSAWRSGCSSEQEFAYEFFVSDERSRLLKLREVSEKELFGKASGGFSYVSADRIGPQDTYDACDSNESNPVGWRGEAVAQVLVDSEKTLVHPMLQRRVMEEDVPVTNVPRQTELWLSEIVRPVQIRAEWIPGTDVISLRFEEPGFMSEWTRPTNTGFGLSNSLPIIVAGLAARENSLLLIENPETHLHPKGQSAIGGFLARVAASGVQVVVETHSDHVLNGIRRSVAIDETLKGRDVVIHFFDDSWRVGGENVQSLDMKDNGDISHWPKYFFDQIEEDLAALARVRRK